MAKKEKELAKGAEGIEGGSFNAKEIQKQAADKGKKIKMNDRIHLILKADSGFYKKGQKIAPHRVYGEKMVADGIAEEYDPKAK